MSEEQAPTTPRWIDRDFRWRGDNVSRLESFSDAVFAIVLALLFLRAAPPETFGELRAAMKSLVPFVAMFAIIAYVWFEHWLFSRRYNLRDGWTAFLNLGLLFLLLFYAYPLKYLFTMLFVMFVGPIGGLDRATLFEGLEGYDDYAWLYIYYGSGYGLIFLVLALLFWRAYRLRDMLQLNELEAYHTKASVVRCVVQVAFAVVSIVLAATGFGLRIGAPGWIYMGIALAMFVVGFTQGNRIQRLRKAAAG